MRGTEDKAGRMTDVRGESKNQREEEGGWTGDNKKKKNTGQTELKGG